MSVASLPELAGIQVSPSRTSLEIPDEISFNQWRRLLERVVRMGESAAWWIGDTLVAGEHFRQDYHGWFEIFDRGNETLRKYAWVARRVPPAFREEQLRFTHHQLVARLEPQEQRRWLDEALRHGWTTRELDQALAEETPRPRPPALTLRAVGDLHDLCLEAAAHAGVEPAEWAASALERAARAELRRTRRS